MERTMKGNIKTEIKFIVFALLLIVASIVGLKTLIYF